MPTPNRTERTVDATDKIPPGEPVIQGQTLEQIEARAAFVKQAEREAFQRIADVFRDIAVTLPPESKYPVRLATAAASIDRTLTLWATTTGGRWESGAWVANSTSERVVQEWERDQLVEIADLLNAYLGRSR